MDPLGQDEEHTANTALCTLCSRAQALISEVLRLKDRLPDVFYPEQNPKFAPVLFDFKYLKTPEVFDERVEASSELLDLWDELRENFMPLIERYFQLFDRVVRYHYDAVRFLEDLQEGVYIQHTLEGLLRDYESRQILVESLSLFGTILLLLDECFDGPVRERIVIAFLRSKGTSDIPNIEEVVRLCRLTGYSYREPAKRPRGYPEDYFGRFQFPETVLLMLVGRLRLDDLYGGIAHYPLPEHRSTALAQQASHVYIMLYFMPEVLHRETAIMRELIDKHFVDNWVVPWGHGFFADLTLVWEPYRAARVALDTAIPSANARRLTEMHTARLAKLRADLPGFLFEGVLDEEFLMASQEMLLGVLREANATLRWLLLHSHGAMAGRLRSAYESRAPPPEQVVVVMLDTAELEFIMKKVTNGLLESKGSRWTSCRQEAYERVNELAEFYAGSKVLSRNLKDDNLRRWFAHIATEIEKLNPERPISTGRKIQQLIAALEEVEQFHQVDVSLQTKQYLLDTRLNLQKMVRIIHVTDASLQSLAVISDTSWAWGPIQKYTAILHERIRKDPFSVLQLRCLFLKLKSVLELPLLRISQIGSPDIYSVGEFYSQELVAYVRTVVEVIPVSMFTILTRIIAVQTDRLRELPTRLEKTSLKEYAQLEERFHLAEATHSVAVLTQGILAMEKTFMGVIEVDPQQLLEDGIRKQVVQHVAESVHNELQFTVKEVGMFSETIRCCTTAEFDAKLSSLAQCIDGFRRSFEYIQDYVNIAGLRVWQEEVGRIINYNVEQECNTFLRARQVHDWQSAYQSDAIPIPRFAPTDDVSLTFMGRLGRELLRQTDPTRTVYLYPLSAWFDVHESGRESAEVLGLRTFSLLRSAVGVAGLAGLDRLYSFMVVHKLQTVVTHYRSRMDAGAAELLSNARRALGPPAGLPEGGLQFYAEALARATKALVWGPLQEAVTFIGQAQLLRRQIASELSCAAHLDSNQLTSALETCNEAVLEDIRAHYRSPESYPYPATDSLLLPEISSLLVATGHQNPLTQIYIMQDAVREFPTLLFFFTLAQLPRYTFDQHLACLRPSRRYVGTVADACPLVVGLVTMLRQFHISQTHAYLSLLGQYARVQAQGAATVLAQDPKARTEHAPELVTLVSLLEAFCRYAQVPRDIVQLYVPPYLMDTIFSRVL